MANVRRSFKDPAKQRGDYALKTAAYTIKNSESGTTFYWDSATSFNFSLPPVQREFKGVYFDFVIKTLPTSGSGHGVSPNSNDYVIVPGATPTDNKDIIFSTTGDAVGNGFRLTSDGKDGWITSHVYGPVTQET